MITNRQRAEGIRRGIRLRNLGRAALRRGLTPTRTQTVAMATRGTPFIDVRLSTMHPSDARGMPMRVQG